MFLLPRHLQRLLGRKKKGAQKRGFAMEVLALGLSRLSRRAGQLIRFEEPRQDRGGQADRPLTFEVFPTDPSVRQSWFSLTIREREVAALVCMGYRNYEIASTLGVGYGTIKTHLQNIFYKFSVHSRKELRVALKSWQAERWWVAHH